MSQQHQITVIPNAFSSPQLLITTHKFLQHPPTDAHPHNNYRLLTPIQTSAVIDAADKAFEKRIKEISMKENPIRNPIKVKRPFNAHLRNRTVEDLIGYASKTFHGSFNIKESQ